MRITRLYLENYYGIYFAMGKSKFELDITKSGNKIIVFKGGNGKGKTTLLSALHPFHETFDKRKDPITPGKNGKKEITIEHNGHLYEMALHYYRKSTNKAYIKKDGHELNENGNITSYKDIILAEFVLTKDYFKISKMGDNVSSFVDMTVTERKNYISKIQPAVDEFLRLFKIVSKKFTLQSKLLTAVADKLGKLPDVKELDSDIESTRSSLAPKREQLTSDNGDLKVLVEKMKEYLTTLPSVEETLKPAAKASSDSAKVLEKNEGTYKDLIGKYEQLKGKTLDELEKKLATANLKSVEFSANITNLNSQLETVQEDIEKSNQLIKDFEAELVSVSPESIKDLEQSIDNMKADIESFKKDLKPFKALQDRLINVYDLDVLKEELLPNVSLVKSVLGYFLDGMVAVFDRIPNGLKYSIVEARLSSLKAEHTGLKVMEKTENEKLDKLNSNYSLYETLQKRPAKCTIDSCAFIVAAKGHDNVPQEIEVVENKLVDIRSGLEKLDVQITALEDASKAIKSFKGLQKSAEEWIEPIMSLSESDEDEAEIDEFLTSDETMDLPSTQVSKRIGILKERLTAFINITKLTDLQAAVDEKTDTLNMLKEKEEKIAGRSKKALESEKEHYDELFERMEETNDKIAENKDSLEKRKAQITILNSIINAIKEIDKSKETLNEYKRLDDLYQKYLEYKESNHVSRETLKISIAQLEIDIENLANKLQGLSNKKSNYVEYKKEHDELSANFENIKNVKKALDPKTGIPLVFTGEYLNRTKAITNRLLESTYEGLFEIDFNITDTEFAIPIIREGADEPSYDIEILSQGEVILVKISLSLAMIEQAMTDYNIMYLDEIDGPLSDINRKRFIKIIEDQIDYLGIEQVFVISHNEAFDAANCDFILMKEASPDFVLAPNQNIIGDFR